MHALLKLPIWFKRSIKTISNLYNLLEREVSNPLMITRFGFINSSSVRGICQYTDTNFSISFQTILKFEE